MTGATLTKPKVGCHVCVAQAAPKHSHHGCLYMSPAKSICTGTHGPWQGPSYVVIYAAPRHGVHVTESASDLVSSCVQRAQEAARSGTLLRMPFETLFEYLKVCCHLPASLAVVPISEHCNGFPAWRLLTQRSFAALRAAQAHITWKGCRRSHRSA